MYLESNTPSAIVKDQTHCLTKDLEKLQRLSKQWYNYIMQNLVRLIELCIKHDAILEISDGNVKVIKYKGVWIPNKRPIL